MYTQVDYLTPMLQLAAAVVCALVGLPLTVHVLLRWRRYRRDARGLRTYQRRSSLRVQASVAGVFLAAALITGGLGWAGLGTAQDSLIANIQRAYPEVRSVEAYLWTGHDAVVDLVMQDGSRYSDVRVGVRESGEPVIDLNGPSDDREGDG